MQLNNMIGLSSTITKPATDLRVYFLDSIQPESE